MFVGIILGLLTWVSMTITFKKLPPVAQYWMKKHPLASDFIAFVATFIGITAISKTLAALFAATIAGLGVDLSFKTLEYLDENPDVKAQLDKKYEKTVGRAQSQFRKFIMSL
jgi:hypothetical protein